MEACVRFNKIYNSLTFKQEFPWQSAKLPDFYLMMAMLPKDTILQLIK